MTIRTVTAGGLFAALVFAVGFGGQRFGGLDPQTKVTLSNATEHNAHAGRLSPGATVESSTGDGSWMVSLRDEAHACARRLILHFSDDVKAGDAFPLLGMDGSDAWVEYQETDEISGATKVWVATSGRVRVVARGAKSELAFNADFEPSPSEGAGAEGSFTLAGTILQ